MFEIAFSEILIIMVVALVVIGPERLPQVARTLGKLWGRLQRYINQVKLDVNSSIALDELREAGKTVKAEADAIERSLKNAGSDIGIQLKQIENELAKAVPEAETPVTPPSPPNLPQNNP